MSDRIKSIVYDIVSLWNKVDDPVRERARIEAKIMKFEEEIAALEQNSMINTSNRYRKAAIWLGAYRLTFGALVIWGVASLFYF